MTRGESLSGQLRCTLIDSLSNRTEQLRGVCLLTKRIFFQDPFDASVMVSEGPKYPCWQEKFLEVNMTGRNKLYSTVNTLSANYVII